MDSKKELSIKKKPETVTLRNGLQNFHKSQKF